MADSPSSDASRDTPTADGSTGNAPTKSTAVKDKECPYCKQRFTSSSLGRHLDQYLKKKRPDGLHDVDEIHKLRGSITRRTARGGRKESRDATRESPAQIQVAVPTVEVDQSNNTPVAGVRASMNTPNWQSTGVINGLPGSKSSMILAPLESTPLPTGTKRTWDNMEQAASRDVLSTRGDLGSGKDTARALELALREVLDSLQAASTRAHAPSSPFDFDVQSQSFPSLTLLLLPPPSTLLTSSIPFSTPSTFPIAPPDRIYLDVIRQKLASRLNDWKWETLRAAQSFVFPTPKARNLGEEQDFLTLRARQEGEMAEKHLELAFQAWMSLDDFERNEAWRLELMRAFVREQEKSKRLEQQVERITQETNQLQQQVNYLSRCQWPREMALWPPDRIPVGKDIFGWGEGGAEPGRWDYDRLLNKWKKIVREDSVKKLGVKVAQTGSNKNATAEGTWPPALWSDAVRGNVNGRESQRTRTMNNGTDGATRKSAKFTGEGGGGGGGDSEVQLLASQTDAQRDLRPSFFNNQ